jgi:transketolase
VRTAFVETLMELAEEDERVFLLTADLGWSVLERFASRYPRRFLNVGVAEANMIGVATGLAMTGFVPWVYSIATFASMRCYEQTRNGPLLNAQPIRIVGIGGGYAYGHGGPTHHALEDLTLARLQPGLAAIAPADPTQMRSVMLALRDRPGSAYLRVGKGGNPEVPGLLGRFAFDRPELVCDGKDVLLITTGAIVHEVLGAAELLGQRQVRAAVAVMAHLSFSAGPELLTLLKSYPAVLTVEEGYTTGGLGSLVAEAVTSEHLPCRVSIRGVREPLGHAGGSEGYLRRRAGLDAASLAVAARALLGQ